MAENNLYEEEFQFTTRLPSQYCPLAKELVSAAEALERDASAGSEERRISDLRLSTRLADWLMYKAGVLDEHFQVWENSEKRAPGTQVNKLGGAVAVAESQYAHALAVAREVNRRSDEIRAAKKQNEASTIAGGSELR